MNTGLTAMNTLAEHRPVTSTVTSFAVCLRPTTRLAKPYHYRRNGIYYLRLRSTGSVVEAASVSLKTSNRRAAMGASELLSGLVRTFHMDNPDSPWSELKEYFRVVSVELLASTHADSSRHLWGGLHADAINRTLNHIGHSAGPVNYLRDVSQPQSVVEPPLVFENLSSLYLADRAGDQKPTTLSSTKFIHGVLSEALGQLNLRTHSRENLVALREQLAATRKPSTVNQMLIKLSAVLKWAVENGHIEKSFDKKLKFTKGLESSRKVFSQEQIAKLMDYAATLPEASWKRWLLSLGVITGGRLNEIAQLTTKDVRTLDSGITVIHINEAGEGKSIKNKRSERMVPLTDGAYGFDLAAFLRYVDVCCRSGRGSLAQLGYRPSGEWVNQQAIPAALVDSYERGLVFHSLRHSLASLMQAKGVPTAYAQAVMGHASGTITFDVYGSGVPVETIAETLRELFVCGGQ
jgi:integrase